MKNNHKGFLYSFTISFSIPFIGLVLSNFFIDPYGIFNKDLWPVVVEPSQYYHKIEKIKENPKKFNSFFVGASTVGFTPPELLESYLPDSRFFSLWFSTVSQPKNLATLKFLIKEGVDVKNIYMQLDTSLLISQKDHGHKDYQRKLHYDVSGESKLMYYFEYLTIFPYKLLLYKLKVNLEGKQKGPTYDFDSGVIVEADRERRIKEDHEAYIKSIDEFFIEKPKRTVKGEAIEFNLKILQEYKKICDDNNINLILLLNPEHRNTIDTTLAKPYTEFIKRLSSVSSFWSFGGYNSITMNNKYYYEPGHHHPRVSRLISARMFNDKSINVPDDFGFYVTKENAEDYSNVILNQFKLRDEVIKN